MGKFEQELLPTVPVPATVDRHALLHPARKRHEEMKPIQINDWEPHVSRVEKPLSPEVIEQGLAYLDKWQQAWREAHPFEGTWVRKMYGIPSLLTRFDCTVVNGELKLYEIEERPAGVGLAGRLSPLFQSKLTDISSTWPDFKVVLSPRRSSTDDSEWRDVINLAAAQRDANQLVLVRADPDETEFHSLTSRSVSSIRAKGSKAYGEKIGLWKNIQSDEGLPFDQAFVLKPAISSKAAGVRVWNPSDGDEVRAQELQALVQEGMLLQPLHAPQSSGIPTHPHMISRIFFGRNLQTEKWEYLGGFWNAAPKVIVDGGNDTIYGPIPPFRTIPL